MSVLNVLRMMLETNSVKFIACAAIDEPEQWHYDSPIPAVKT